MQARRQRPLGKIRHGAKDAELRRQRRANAVGNSQQRRRIYRAAGMQALAMNESEKVRGWNRGGPNRVSRRNRWFPIDPAAGAAQQGGLSPMYAHFKDGARSGGAAVRMYFSDDTKGATGRVVPLLTQFLIDQSANPR